MTDSPILWTKEQCVEAYDEMMIKIALSSYAELDGEESLEENERLKATPEYAVTPEIEKRIRRTVQREYFRKSVRRTAGRVYRAASLVAVIFMGVSILFGTTVYASSEVREKLFYWFVDTFPEFSYFRVEADPETTETSYDELLLYKPTYIPDGFSESTMQSSPLTVSYSYANSEGYQLFVTGRMPGGSQIGLNTEGAEIETLTFRGEKAHYWEQETSGAYFTFILDGYHFFVYGPVDRSEIFKIADNIKIP